jgi:hypothetical protein
VDTFVTSSFGTFGMTVWHGVLSAPSWQYCPSLASGWARAAGRQPITPARWGRGAAHVKQCSRSEAFVGHTLAHRRAALGARGMRWGASLGPAAALRATRLEEAPRQQIGWPIQGAAPDRNGAGTARQA